jgi:hypothetical protein
MSKFENHLDELRVTKERTPKIAAQIKKRAMEGQRLSKELSRWFEAMLRNIDDLDGKDAMKIMNMQGKIKEAAKSVGIG